MMDTEALRAVADRQAITDLIYRYCRAVDRLDIPLGHSIWHADATADYGPGYYQGPGRGVIDKICSDHQRLVHHSHQITNVIIDLDGDRAGSESCCFATLRAQLGERLMQMMIWTRYVDQWSRRDGHWGIDHRIAIREFDEIRDVTPMQANDVGKRDHSDPSYGVLKTTT